MLQRLLVVLGGEELAPTLEEQSCVEDLDLVAWAALHRLELDWLHYKL